MKKIFVVAGTVVFLAAIAVGYQAYEQAKYDKQKLSSEATTTTATQEGEEVFTGGDAHMADCVYDAKNQCKLLEINTRIELSDSVKNSTYIVTVNGARNNNGWYNTYFIGLPMLGVRFLDASQGLIAREDYNKLFAGSEISAKTPVQTFSVHCSGDKNVLPTVTSPYCYPNSRDEDSYLFNYKGERLASVAEVKKYSIYDASGWANYDFNSLETIKKMKASEPAMFSTFPDGYISADSPLEKIDVVYSGAIEDTQYGTRLVPKDKIEEISYFKDGSQTTIKIK